MSGSVSVYSFENAAGDQDGCYTTQDFDEAREHAAKYKLRLIENIYEWAEAIPVEECDFTEAEGGEDS